MGFLIKKVTLYYILTFVADNVSGKYVFNDLISSRESAEHQWSWNSEL